MEALKKVLMLGLLFSLSEASMESFFKNNTDASFTQVAPGYFRTQSTHHQTFGSMRVRWGGMGTTSLVHITPPRMSIGCNGIDLAFGSFSYLDPAEFIEKAKKIAQAAPAFAFKMALSTLCKECDTIMQELEAATDLINSLSMDSCGIAEAAGTWAGAAIGESVRPNGTDYMEEYRVFTGSGEGSNNVRKYVSGIKSALSGDWNTNKKKKLYGSMIDYIFENSNGYSSAEKVWMKPLVRGIYGDMVVYLDEGESKEVQVIVPSAINEYTFIIDLMEGKGSSPSEQIGLDLTLGNKLKDGSTSEVVSGFSADEVKVLDIYTFFSGGAIKIISDKLKIVKDKISTRSTLSTTDIAFLESVPLPIWKALNVEVSSIRSGISSKLFEGNIEKSIAVAQVENFLDYFSGTVTRGIAMAVMNSDNLASPEARERLLKWRREIDLKKNVFKDALSTYKTKNNVQSSKEVNEEIENAIAQIKKSALMNVSSKFN